MVLLGYIIVCISIGISFLDSLMVFLSSFLVQKTMLSVMQSLAIGLVTITIAIAIYLTKNSHNGAFDRDVILDEIIRSKLFFIYFFLLFLPQFLWGLSNKEGRILLFFIYVIGVFGFSKILFSSYKWLKEFELTGSTIRNNYRPKKRMDFLKSLVRNSQKTKLWDHVWDISPTTFSEEKDYVELYISEVETVLEKKKLKELEEYLRSLNNSLEKLGLDRPKLLELLFENSLNWYKTILTNDSEETDEVRRRLLGPKYQAENLIRNLIRTGFDKGFESLIFNKIKENIKKEDISGDGRKVVQSIVNIAGPIIFSQVSNATERNHFFSLFEDEWRVTKDKLKDSENVIANIWAKSFIEWAAKRLRNYTGKDIDKELDNAFKGLFQNTDPITFSILFSLRNMRSWSAGRRMESFIDTPRKFGYSSHFYSINEETDIEKILDKEEKNAIEICKMIYNNFFVEERIDKFITELKSLEFEEDEEGKKTYRDRVIRTLKRMKDHLNSE